jgi:uncharacterized membrane protein YkgB
MLDPSLGRRPMVTIASSLQTIERRIAGWTAAHTTTLTRAALGLIFLWFGLLKFCPGLCDVELMAQKTLVFMTFGLFSPAACIRFLAIWECAMGLTLLLAPGRTRWGVWALRLCVVSLLLHLAGTFLPLALFPSETWKHLPLAPTLAGQYILKNLVLIASVISVGANAFAQPARLELLPSNTAFQPLRRRA